MKSKLPATKKRDPRRKVWTHKDHKGKKFFGAYVKVLNKKSNLEERLLVLTDAAVANPKKKDTHYVDSHEGARSLGWKAGSA